MRGNLDIPFSTLFADTVAFHGVAWAKAHYIKGGMPAWEFCFWYAQMHGQPVLALS